MSFAVKGKLSDKSFKRTGVSEKGPWKLIVFLLEKTRKHKKIWIPILAKGKWADVIDNTAVGEKLRIEFYIEGKEFNNNWKPECIATLIEKYIPKASYKHGEVAVGNETMQRDVELREDKNLFNT